MKKSEEIERVRCGGVYCKECGICICKPRQRKNYCPTTYMLCDECKNKENILIVTFLPREDSIKTEFRIYYEDIPDLISFLAKGLKKIIEPISSSSSSDASHSKKEAI